MVRPIPFLLLLFFVVCAQPFALAQNTTFAWVKQFEATDQMGPAHVAYDPNGAVVLCGSFADTVDVDPGAGVVQLMSNGEVDVFVQKMDTAGNLIWAVQFGGPELDGAFGVETDQAGNIYVTGNFEDTVDFDPGPGVTNLISAGDDDIFVLKLDPAGNFEWAHSFGDIGIDYGIAVTLDSQSNVYFAGVFSLGVDFDPGPAVNTIWASGSFETDGFILKLDSAGNFLWAHGMGGWNGGGINAIALDPNENVLVTGWFDGTGDFDPGAGVFNMSSLAFPDVFIEKLDPAGNFIWAGSLPGNDYAVGNAIVSDAAGNVYVTGHFWGNQDLDPGAANVQVTANGFSEDVFTVKWTANGQYAWGFSHGGSGTDSGIGIAVDSTNDIYLSGTFSGTTDFDPGPNAFQLTSQGIADIYLHKIDSSGAFIWAKGASGTGYEYASEVVLDADENIYACGAFENTVDFDPATSTANRTATGNFDGFLWKFVPCQPVSGSLTDTVCHSFLSPSGNYTYTTSGTYFDTLLTAGGCDSIITLQLTILHATDTTLAITTCNQFLSPSGNYLWTSSGTYQDTLANAAGCDSVITVQLQILPSTVEFINVAACETYTSPSGLFTWTTSGFYQDTLVNTFGCDSFLNINLTIDNPSFTAFSTTACNSYLSPSGQYTWTTSGTYQDTIVTPAGCDSVLTITLTVLNASASSFQTTACGSFASPSGRYNWTTSGTYTDTLVNAVGCDSVITIQLTVLPQPLTQRTDSVCAPLLSPSGQYTWTESGLYRDTLTAANGCDSILEIDLTVTELDLRVLPQGTDLTALAQPATFRWLDCNNNYQPLNDATSRTLTEVGAGLYAVEVSHRGCVDTSACLLGGGPPFIRGNCDNGEALIYPNPVRDNLFVELEDASAVVELDFRDAQGRLVGQLVKRNVRIIETDLLHAAGFYTVEIRSNDGIREVCKLIKQ